MPCIFILLALRGFLLSCVFVCMYVQYVRMYVCLILCDSSSYLKENLCQGLALKRIRLMSPWITDESQSETWDSSGLDFKLLCKAIFDSEALCFLCTSDTWRYVPMCTLVCLLLCCLSRNLSSFPPDQGVVHLKCIIRPYNVQCPMSWSWKKYSATKYILKL